jgi:hypothetical protein
MSTKRSKESDRVVSSLEEAIDVWKVSPHTELEIRLDSVSPLSYEMFREQLGRCAGTGKWGPKVEAKFLSAFSKRDATRESSVRTRFSTETEPVSEIVRSVIRISVTCPTRSSSIQFSVKEEIPTATDFGCTDHYMIRVHDRLTVTYDKNWLYSAEDVRTGHDKDNIETSIPEYSVEIEISPHLKHTPTPELARLMIGRACDLLCRFDEFGNREELTLEFKDKRVKTC